MSPLASSDVFHVLQNDLAMQRLILQTPIESSEKIYNKEIHVGTPHMQIAAIVIKMKLNTCRFAPCIFIWQLLKTWPIADSH